MHDKESIARLNSLLSAQEAEHVQPEDHVFILRSSELEQIIQQSIEKASEPLLTRIKDLEDMTARERAYDRQRIAKLEQEEPQALQKDRGEMLRLLIASNGGKMLAKDARRKLHISESAFSLLVSSLKEYIVTKPYHLRKNQNVLILKSTLAKEERTF